MVASSSRRTIEEIVGRSVKPGSKHVHAVVEIGTHPRVIEEEFRAPMRLVAADCRNRNRDVVYQPDRWFESKNENGTIDLVLLLEPVESV